MPFKNIPSRIAIILFSLLFSPFIHAEVGNTEVKSVGAITTLSYEMKRNLEEDRGLYIFEQFDIEEGVIEFEVKGSDDRGRSFLGLAFAIQDPFTYEVIYFRPFNFNTADKKYNSIQYMSMPENSWSKLRATSPGIYEGAPNTSISANDWFSVKLVLKNDRASVFVEDQETASLTIKRLTNTTSGKIGFWTGGSSVAEFRNLTVSR